VAAQLGNGGDFAGYRFATPEDVSQLFSDAGITNPYPTYAVDPATGMPNGDASAITNLLSLMRTGADNIVGYVSTPLASDPTFAHEIAQLLLTASMEIAQSPAYLLYSNSTIAPDYRDNDGTGDWGSFLVRDLTLNATPIPAVGIPALIFGAVLLVWCSMKRKPKGNIALYHSSLVRARAVR
jgi:hypothetical protein